MPKFLEQWCDPHYKVPAPDDWGQWEAQQLERLRDTIIMARHAHSIPRRIGGDATPRQLATDKRFSKRLTTRCLRIAQTYGATLDELDDYMLNGPPNELELLRAKGAQVDWETWFTEEYAPARRADLVFVASHTFGQNKQLAKLGNRLAMLLFNELTQINQIFEECFV